MNRSTVALGVLSLVVVALQVNVLSAARLFGVVVMVTWMWSFCIGLFVAPRVAAIIGAAIGLVFDTQVATPFGLDVLVGALLGYAASLMAREGVVGSSPVATVLVGGVVGFIAPLAFVCTGFLTFTFNLWRGSLVISMVVNAVTFAILILPLTSLLASATGLRGSRS